MSESTPRVRLVSLSGTGKEKRFEFVVEGKEHASGGNNYLNTETRESVCWQC